MSEIWNLWDVKPPPICSVMTKLHLKEINSLTGITYNALKTVKDLDHLNKEAAILSRFLYRYKRIFRQDKGMQNLVKVSQCLKRYLKLNMFEVLVTFKRSLPFKLNPTATHAYLPTRQMLKWVLLRLQAFSQIFSRMIELTKATGLYVYKKLCLGWSLNHTVLVYCMTARILVTSKYLVAKSIEWYGSFYQSLPVLQETSDFLPNYKFPVDLKAWLGQVDLTPLKKKSLIDNVFDFIDLAKEEDAKERDEDNEMEIISGTFLKGLFKSKFSDVDDSDIEEIEVQKCVEPEKEVKLPLKSSSTLEDLGVPVEVNEERTLGKARKRKKEKKEKQEKRVNNVKKVKITNL